MMEASNGKLSKSLKARIATSPLLGDHVELKFQNIDDLRSIFTLHDPTDSVTVRVKVETAIKLAQWLDENVVEPFFEGQEEEEV